MCAWGCNNSDCPCDNLYGDGYNQAWKDAITVIRKYFKRDYSDQLVSPEALINTIKQAKKDYIIRRS